MSPLQVKFTYNTKGENTKIERYLDGLLKVTTDNAYDIYGRLTGIVHVKGITPTNPTGTPISDDVYVLDNLNRLQTQTKGGQVKEIGYDKTDQVQTVTGGAGEAYTYDLNGNRTNGGYTTGVDNRLTSDGTYSYLYDPEGNRQSRTNILTNAVDEYTWDYRNRLTGIVSKDSGGAVIKTVGYTYDVDDQRVSKTVTTGTGSTTEKYYLDGNQVAFVTDDGGNQMFHYLYGLNVDQVMAQDSPAGMVWALADRLGSIDTLTDGEGVVVDKRTFDSFGRVLSQSNPSVSFRYGYTGRELDLESGLNYYRARYYDPANGRFISVDPMGFGAGDTNLYRYVGNSSTNATDPSGELAQAVGGAIFGGIAGGLYALANDIENHEFGLNTIGHVLAGAAVGALAGALITSGVGLLAGAATTYFETAVAGAVVNNVATAGFTAYGAHSAGGNFGQGRYLSGTLDLLGVAAGASKVFSGITRDIPTIRQQEFNTKAANARTIYQIDDPQSPGSGSIVTSRSWSTATTPPGWNGSVSDIIPSSTIFADQLSNVFNYTKTNLVNPLSGDPWLTPIEAERVNHSNLGDFTNPQSKALKEGKVSRFDGGGHGQSNINKLTGRGIEYNMVYEFKNGVRTGNVPTHTTKSKQSNVGQSWFPENWNDAEIEAAERFVANSHGGTDRFPGGTILFANYKGIRTGIIITNKYSNSSRIGTIFPDNSKQPTINPDLFEKNPHYTGK